jgi:hypothetical protein
MAYDFGKLSISCLLEPAFRAEFTLTRLDERIARSPVGAGWIERSQFTDACASLWVDGELVHLEDLVLHDDVRDIRTPTHELTIARDVLRTRRRIAAQPPGWALTNDGLRTMRKTAEITSADAGEVETAGAIRPAVATDPKGEGMTPTTSKTSPASTTLRSMRCWPDRTPPSKMPRAGTASPAVGARKKIR